MEIVKALPPNFEAIVAKFDLAGFNPIFTYGDKLYNPAGLPIPEDLMAHEETHQRQQRLISPVTWWQMYLDSDSFRLEQELEAYRNQYQYTLEHYSRPYRRQLLKEMAKNLSSKLYGNIINFQEAEELIKHGN